MKKAIFLIIAFTLVGCGKDNIERVIQTKTETVQLPAPMVDEVQQIIQEENEYRLASGQLSLSSGLTCTLHNLASTTPSAIPSSPPAAVATFVYQGSFNQPNSPASDGLNILPAALRPLYTQWYLVKCQGQIVIVDSAYTIFHLTSDDGSKLYIDNSVLVDNDGNHGSVTKSGSRLLKRGVHTFRLDYMQGPSGSQSLILENSQGVISGEYFYR